MHENDANDEENAHNPQPDDANDADNDGKKYGHNNPHACQMSLSKLTKLLKISSGIETYNLFYKLRAGFKFKNK